MQNEHYLDYQDLTTEKIREYLNENPHVKEITCLVPRGDESTIRTLEATGFRYFGKRLENGEVIEVFKWFMDIEQYEEMGVFFDRRIEGYNQHMRDGLYTYESDFMSLFEPIPQTNDRITVLDLGCGTGIELEFIFRKAPNAYIVGIDVSGNMLRKLREDYRDFNDNINLRKVSYLEEDFGEFRYDFVVACSTLHHLLPEEKSGLYRKIHGCLKEDGYLLINDYIVFSTEEEEAGLSKYMNLLEEGIIKKDKIYHIDLPLTLEHEVELLEIAGFLSPKVERIGENGVMISVGKTKEL